MKYFESIMVGLAFLSVGVAVWFGISFVAGTQAQLAAIQAESRYLREQQAANQRTIEFLIDQQWEMREQMKRWK